MKKTITLFSVIFMLLVLAACSSAAKTDVAVSISSNPLSTNDQNTLSLPVQLAIGTLKLESTENKIDTNTAKELLPLWKAVRSLSESDTTSSIEIDALYKQIQATMTPAQTEAISVMNLTRDSMRDVFQELGLSFGPGGGNLTTEQRATMEASRGGGQAGGPPGGGMPGFGPGGEAPPAEMQTQMASQGGAPGMGSGSGLNSALLEAVIKLLEEKIQ